MTVVEYVDTTYLRFGLRISEKVVEIRSPEGRRLGQVPTLSSARRFVRSYRRVQP